MAVNINLQAIIQSTNDSIILTNTKGEIILWNKASTKIFEFTEKEALGKKINIIIPDKHQKNHNSGMNNFRLSGKKNIIGSTVELEAKKKSGQYFPVELTLSTWYEKDKVFVCGIIRDISARKATQKHILDLSRIIDASPSCLKFLDKRGSLLKMNRVGLDLIEAENFKSVSGASVYDLVQEQDREAFILFNKFICKGGEGTLIFKIKGLKGTERTMESFARSHPCANGELGHLAITNDISDRVRAKQEIYQKDQALRDSQRLSVIGEFAAGIAHEINNPLSIIYAKSQLLDFKLTKIFRSDQAKFEPIKKSLESIMDTITHTSDIINNLKTFSHSTDFTNLAYHKIDDVINMTLKLCQKRCQNAGVQLKIDVNKNIEILCSAVGLSQVLLNLIHNSFDAIEMYEEKWIKIETLITDTSLKIIITDSGKGIDAKHHDKILQPFFTTKDPGKGTGLGLSISENNIKKMRGSLRHNKDAKNTQFVIKFKKYR
jgi:PAS domain S-box-containing protein